MTVSRSEPPLPTIEPMAAAARLARELDTATLAALVAFAESDRDGAMVLRRHGGTVRVELPGTVDLQAQSSPRQARAM